MAGYTKQVVISGVKAIDNWFSHKVGAERDWNELRKSFTQSSKMIPDERFIEICKDIGFAPKYQYQLIQLVVQLKPEVLKHAEKEEIGSK